MVTRSPWLQGDKDTIKKVQEKAENRVSRLKEKAYLEKCAKLGIETLEDRRRGQDMVLVHKFLIEKTEIKLFQ
jgi:hypothetical protein